MSPIHIENKKAFKKQIFETLYTRLDNSLVEYKEILGKKKLNRFIKKATKELAGEIKKETKQADKRTRKLQKKAAKLKGRTA
jgi:hypothetical protein